MKGPRTPGPRKPGTSLAPPRTYAVGYGKPPEATRFQKGQSGNPKGRPRGAKTQRPALNEERMKAIILDEAYRTITVQARTTSRQSDTHQQATSQKHASAKLQVKSLPSILNLRAWNSRSCG